MKGLNNRGFAISTLLYGLMIMSLLIVFALISNLGTNRQTSSSFVDKIEDELNRLSAANTEGVYVGGEVDSNGREYIAPSGGWYKIELWGASGGSGGSRGAYTSGTMYLEENEHIYFYVGQQGGNENSFNSGSSGGGATDVRLINGEWDNEESLLSRVMVAGGGGASGDGGSLVGYGTDAGTQSTGVFGRATSTTAGGGGYYGATGDGGGSSFIMGYAGVRVRDSVGVTQDTNKGFSIHKGDYDPVTGDKILEPYSAVIYNGFIVEGVNSGDGAFRIVKVSDNGKDNPPRDNSNTKLSQVKYIRDCVVSDGDETNMAYWLEIQAIQGGNNLARASGVQVTSSGGTLNNGNSIIDGIADQSSSMASMSGTGEKCVTVVLPSAQDLDEVAVWHRYGSSNYTIDHNLAVSTDGSNWRYIRNKSTDRNTDGQQNEIETSDGIRYNSFQYDVLGEIPDGNYYIFSADSNDQVLTAKDEHSSIIVNMQTFTGSDEQIWRVYKSGTKYRIENTKHQKVMNAPGSTVGTLVTLTDNSDSNVTQTFSISTLQNGYYKITSNSGRRLGYTSSEVELAMQNTNQNKMQRWKFVLASY